MDDVTRFLIKVDIDRNTGCWVWKAHRRNDGYGLFWLDGKTLRAHRWSFTYFREKIKDGHQLNHRCRNKPCVNPWHLEQMTHQQHLAEPDSMISLKRSQTHCKRGHILAGDNLLITKSGCRKCRACRRMLEKKAYHEGRRK